MREAAAGEPLHVLVVDDDPMVASVHSGFVQAVPGCRVVGIARTGGEALELVQRLRPDVVLLDLYLPDLPGLEVLARLRGTGADVDVVVISAAREASTVREALRGGVAGYLIKPFGADQLGERLEHVRAARRALAPGVLRQADVDRALGVRAGAGAARPGASARLPKGLSAETAELVSGALDAATIAVSASEVAEQLGLSRVAVRRYLEHFVDERSARVRLRYGTGRPERLYERVR
ncbi:response regulator [Kineococcus indalonis]|uniref:response regulator n=1 Tax=Kineococcus indalonis TaxID=2696566 RepID=UPI00141287B6|nr:response regulator [Kineococcus indalonis]NAZ85370.1 response regulator [Kineococcus indalonis]